MNWPHSKTLLEANSKWVPGGLASLNRKADPTIAFGRAKGSRLWDLDGHEYIDYHAGFAPYILGHGDDEQIAAVSQSMADGLSNWGSGPTRDEGELARLFLQAVPHAEKVQFFNTGSEATSQAIRVARAATHRSHVIKIQGSYNGHHNMVAANLMSSKQSLGGKPIRGDEYPLVPITAGIPPEEQALIHAVPFNDLDAIETVLKRYPIAAIITEPVLQNIGVIRPRPGYLEGLRQLADRFGSLLILDEVKTGFRAALGGYQSLVGAKADLSTYGKALANGFPIAAMAGKAEYMDLACCEDLQRRVLVAGTYNCHPVPVAAAIACLKKLLDPKVDVYGTLERRAQQLERGQREIFVRHSIPHVICRVGSAHCVYFTNQEPHDWWSLLDVHDFDFDVRYRRALIDRGIYNFPVPVKQGSISFAHSEADIDATLNALDDTLNAISIASSLQHNI